MAVVKRKADALHDDMLLTKPIHCSHTGGPHRMTQARPKLTFG